MKNISFRLHSQQYQLDPDDYDYLFTPEVVAELDAAAAEARTGNNLTREQMREHLAAHRQTWLENHPA